MSAYKQLEKLHDFWKRRFIPMCVMATVFCVCLITMSSADALPTSIKNNSSSGTVVSNALKEKAAEDFSSKFIYWGTWKTGSDTTLPEGKAVTIYYNGATVSTRSEKETVSALLSRMHLQPGAHDLVLLNLSGNEVTLEITSHFTHYEKSVEPVSCQTKYVKSAYLLKGKQKVIQNGSNGTRTAVYKVIYKDGKQESRQYVKTESCTACDKIVAVGTVVPATKVSAVKYTVKKSVSSGGVILSNSGVPLHYSAVKTMTATAYTRGTEGVGSITASGTTVRKGIVAVDPKVIPLGTRLYIVTSNGSVIYGYAVAEDTGVYGNSIDLYYDTYAQCVNFGRRSCKVYILK